MGETGELPPGGSGDHMNPSASSSSSSRTNMTSAWAGGAGPAGQSRKQRSFAEIMADQKQKRNIMEIIFTKIERVNNEGKVTRHRNLTFDEIGTFLFDVLKISPTECLRFNYSAGRFDTKEVMFKSEVDISPRLSIDNLGTASSRTLQSWLV